MRDAITDTDLTLDRRPYGLRKATGRQPGPYTTRLPAWAAIGLCTKYITIREITAVVTTTYPSRSKCRSEPSASCAISAAASTEPSPPESCCREAPTALKEPRCAGSGIAEISACDGIMREKMPTNIKTLTRIATVKLT